MFIIDNGSLTYRMSNEWEIYEIVDTQKGLKYGNNKISRIRIEFQYSSCS